jgi:hypothetical protein
MFYSNERMVDVEGTNLRVGIFRFANHVQKRLKPKDSGGSGRLLREEEEMMTTMNKNPNRGQLASRTTQSCLR